MKKVSFLFFTFFPLLVLAQQVDKNSSESNKYISSADFNGKAYNNWLSHAALLQGGVFNFNLSAEPNKQRGTEVSSFPYSLSADK